MERAVYNTAQRRRFDDTWPLTFKVLETFPVVAVLRVNKVLATLVVLVLLNMTLSSISSGFYIAIGVSGAIVLAARWLSDYCLMPLLWSFYGHHAYSMSRELIITCFVQVGNSMVR